MIGDVWNDDIPADFRIPCVIIPRGDSQTIPQFLAQESVTGVPVAEMWMGDSPTRLRQ